MVNYRREGHPERSEGPHTACCLTHVILCDLHFDCEVPRSAPNDNATVTAEFTV